MVNSALRPEALFPEQFVGQPSLIGFLIMIFVDAILYMGLACLLDFLLSGTFFLVLHAYQ